MPIPLQIKFRNMDRSGSLEQEIRERAEKLERFSDRIIECRVLVETRHRHQQGNLFHVRIDLAVPGNDIVVGREADLDHSHEDVYVAVRDAFDAVRRRCEDQVRRRDQRVKAHEPSPRGRIARLDHGKDCGFIETADGREIYFHRNSVLNEGYAMLQVGDPVRFHEEAGDKGPQASTVRVEK
ncbi:MAG: raiA ribosome-associated inhibitor [Deltaproteobacteria bacterium]|nr:raiA ribosome-associated inhibitor [Deltaproteobacteria bacterium]